ncbi:MAG TPA: hypothetical protein VGY48_16015 [Vicinamibacterales bacterium]|jgi:hypothetical protein|nr:hypothetical protein [Vicinamibacterales bacterium]
MTPPPDDALTAVTRRPQPSGATKTVSTLIGLGIALCSAGGSYFAYRQAKVEAGAETHTVRATADIGYQTSTQAITLLQAAVREHDAEIAWLKLVCKPEAERMSSPEPVPPPPAPSLVPLQRAQLFRALPRTLDAAKIAVEAK